MTESHLPAEQEEAWAIYFVHNGNGIWPIPKNNPLFAAGFTRAIVSYHVEDSTRVTVFLKGVVDSVEITLSQYDYKLVKTEAENLEEMTVEDEVTPGEEE